MSATVEQLLDELVERWARGEQLQVDELLVRAGPQSDELAALIETFLQRAGRREPTPEALDFVRSFGDPPLLRARQARSLKLDDIVTGLVDGLGLSAGARAKVRRYYQDLELGQLDATGVAANVWDALTGLLGRDARVLAAVPPTAPQAAAMYREANVDHDIPRHAPRVFANTEESDVVDLLFGVTPDG